MADEVVHVLPKPEDVPAVGDGLDQLAHHPDFVETAGAIDGGHIRIHCPGGPDGQDYMNQ